VPQGRDYQSRKAASQNDTIDRQRNTAAGDPGGRHALTAALAALICPLATNPSVMATMALGIAMIQAHTSISETIPHTMLALASPDDGALPGG